MVSNHCHHYASEMKDRKEDGEMTEIKSRRLTAFMIQGQRFCNQDEKRTEIRNERLKKSQAGTERQRRDG